MKYIIMCGGQYPQWETPRQLLKIYNETLVQRTIRLLKQAGARDIAISANNDYFDNLGVEVIKHDNSFVSYKSGYWVDAFPLVDYPVCYLFGDVVYSPQAIEIIVNTVTFGIKFFASSPPFDKHYIKQWAEPFAFKVMNTEKFKEAVQRTKQLQDENKFLRVPIAWELWQVIKGTPLNLIDYNNYIKINDYTCDIDSIEDLQTMKEELDRLWHSI